MHLRSIVWLLGAILMLLAGHQPAKAQIFTCRTQTWLVTGKLQVVMTKQPGTQTSAREDLRIFLLGSYSRIKPDGSFALVVLAEPSTTVPLTIAAPAGKVLKTSCQEVHFTGQVAIDLGEIVAYR